MYHLAAGTSQVWDWGLTAFMDDELAASFRVPPDQ